MKGLGSTARPEDPTFRSELERVLGADASSFVDGLEVEVDSDGTSQFGGGTVRELPGDIWNAATAAVRGARVRQLRISLERLATKDRSFDPKSESATYLGPAIKTVLTGEFDTVVYGHTHLAKQIDLRPKIEASADITYEQRRRIGDRKLTYLNTGTWADVVRLPSGLVEPDATQKLNAFIDALGKSSFDDYRKQYLTYAELRIAAGDGAVQESGVHSFCGAGRAREPVMTEFPRLKPTAR